jgi:hypothetical protein
MTLQERRAALPVCRQTSTPAPPGTHVHCARQHRALAHVLLDEILEGGEAQLLSQPDEAGLLAVATGAVVPARAEGGGRCWSVTTWLVLHLVLCIRGWVHGCIAHGQPVP